MCTVGVGDLVEKGQFILSGTEEKLYIILLKVLVAKAKWV